MAEEHYLVQNLITGKTHDMAKQWHLEFAWETRSLPEQCYIEDSPPTFLHLTSGECSNLLHANV